MQIVDRLANLIFKIFLAKFFLGPGSGFTWKVTQVNMQSIEDKIFNLNIVQYNFEFKRFTV